MKVLATAPGKATLFGEHSVVYGRPAIAMAINRRVTVELTSRKDDKAVLHFPDVSVKGFTLTFKGEAITAKTNKANASQAAGYVVEAIRTVAKRLGDYRGVNVTVKSEMPVGAGLGTSAAVAIATAAAYSELLGKRFDGPALSRIGREVELRVQKVSSGMDSSVIALGGLVEFQLKGSDLVAHPLHFKEEMPMVLGYCPRISTTAQSVARVAQLRDRNIHVIEKVFDSIEQVVLEAKKKIVGGETASLGELMNINQGLLSALGVSTLKIEEMVYAARKAGASGAKLTGAGMGGSVLCLVNSSTLTKPVALALSTVGAESFVFEPDYSGVRVQHV